MVRLPLHNSHFLFQVLLLEQEGLKGQRYIRGRKNYWEVVFQKTIISNRNVTFLMNVLMKSNNYWSLVF